MSGCKEFNKLSVLQTQGPGSPRSSPSHTTSRSIPTPIHSDSAVTTPTHTPQDSLMGVGGDVQEAFAQGTTAIPSVVDAVGLLMFNLFFLFLSVFFERSTEKSEKRPPHCCWFHHQHDVIAGQRTQFRWELVNVSLLNQNSGAGFDGFSPQRAAARQRAPWIPNLDAVTFWRRPLRTPSSHTNRGRESYTLPQLADWCSSPLIYSFNGAAAANVIQKYWHIWLFLLN